MDESLDIWFEIRFIGYGGVSVEVLTSVLKQVTWAIESAEKDELDELVESFPDWSGIARDAMRYRFDRVDRDRLLNIERASNGSIILAGAAIGLAYWVVDKTLGETVKDAWKDSDGHTRLKEFLKKRVFSKRDQIASRLQPIRFRTESSIASIDVRSVDLKPMIVVSVMSEEADLLPKPSQIEGKRGDA